MLALESLSGFLKGTIAPDSDYYTHEIAWSFENVADQRSFALRLLIHYVGDLHQPLHAVSEVDHSYPKGDSGGNDHKIPSEDGVANLHQVWDSVIYNYLGYADLVSHFSHLTPRMTSFVSSLPSWKDLES